MPGLYEALTRQSNVDSLKFAAGLGGWGVISILLNMVVVRIPQKAQIPAFIASGAAAVLILTMLTSAWMAIPVAVVRTLGLGEIPVGVVLRPKDARPSTRAHVDSRYVNWMLTRSWVGHAQSF